MGSAYQRPRQGDGHNDLLGPGTKAQRHLLRGRSGEEWKKPAGSPAALCNQLPWSQRPWRAAAQHCGERLGEGEAAFVPSFAASPPDLGQPPRQAGAAFQVPQLQAGTSQQGLRTRKGCLLSECVKQRPAGFPGRKPGSGLHTRHLGGGG